MGRLVSYLSEQNISMSLSRFVNRLRRKVSMGYTPPPGSHNEWQPEEEDPGLFQSIIQVVGITVIVAAILAMCS
jgi:hypothetical protein